MVKTKKGADQLHGYREADLLLCFRICQNVGLLMTWLICIFVVCCLDYMSRVTRKPVLSVSNHVRHKPGCTATEDGYMLEISDLGNSVIVLSMICAFVFAYTKSKFSHYAAHIMHILCSVIYQTRVSQTWMKK